MWNRIDLKISGKACFKSKYWLYVAVSVLLTIALGGRIFNGVFNVDSLDAHESFYYDYNRFRLLGFIIPTIVGSLGILSIAFKILVANPYEVGACRFFAESRINASTDFTAVKAGFSKRYGNIILTQFLKNLYIALLSLLFVIPGIVRALGYFAVPYILAENPELDHNRALSLSRQMTMGFKGSIFGTMFSFIGWYILSGITAGIVGVFYVFPYVNATRAEMYAFLRENALRNGIATIGELPGFGFPSNYAG